MGDTQTEEVNMPDTASPYDPIPTGFCGWGRLVPLGCTLPAKDLIDATYTIGREKRCEVSITEFDIKPDIHKQISKIHCRIARRKVGATAKEVVILEDLSSNGTFVNGKKIGRSNHTIIASEDEISFAAPQNKIFLFVDGAKMDFIYPRELTDRYLVTDHIGTGGFAEVYLMLNRETCAQYAVKKISKAGVAEKKIFNEINILRKLRHKCIVEMVEVVQSKDAAFIVMEYVPDGTLLDRIKREKRLDEQLCKLIFFQLAWAVDYLHTQGVTHRDIKPENILVEERPDIGAGLLVVKVADFGLSKIISSMTNLKTACGTLQYTAPEVLEAKGLKEYSNKVDIWGIGVVLFVSLSGRRPFLAKPDDAATLIRLIRKGTYSFATPEWSAVSLTAKSLVKSLLTTNPALRLETKAIFNHPWLKDQELLDDLSNLFGSDSPIPYASGNEENFEPPLKVARLEITS